MGSLTVSAMGLRLGSAMGSATGLGLGSGSESAIKSLTVLATGSG